jgi:ESS family glutamate:Na+ symporter
VEPGVLQLNLINTVAFAGIVLFVGYAIKRRVPVFSNYNVPAPVIGGLLIALTATIARRFGVTLFTFDTTLQVPLMIAFFTSVGFAASLSLLRVGGPLVLIFLIASTIVAVGQNVLGVALAWGLQQHPLMGVLAGSVTLTGGPATGLAFAPAFEQAGVPGAATLAVAAAMVGIVSGGIIGAPLGTFLIRRHHLKTAPEPSRAQATFPATAANVVQEIVPEPVATPPPDEDIEAYGLLKHLVVILTAMWAGGWVSGWFSAAGITLPAYIGAMMVAAVMRNLDDTTGVFRLSQRTIDDLGSVSLSLFLVLALMTLRLWELAGLALPLAVMLVAQVAMVAGLCLWPIFPLMGRDYESAVISGGFCGFMLGTTANSMANMEALVQRYGPAPKAFLVVPMVGAFFIDFLNAIIITVFLNVFS